MSSAWSAHVFFRTMLYFNLRTKRARKTARKTARGNLNEAAINEAAIKHLLGEILFLRKELVEQRKINAIITSDILTNITKTSAAPAPENVSRDTVQSIPSELPDTREECGIVNNATDTQECFTKVIKGPKCPNQLNSWSPELSNSYSGLPVEVCTPIIAASTVDSNEIGDWFNCGQANRGGEQTNITMRRKTKRPQILTNERHLQNYIPTRPGNHSYVDAVSKGDSVLIVADSTLNRIRKREFYKNVESCCRVQIKSLPGEGANTMHAFLRAKLSEERRSCVVVHGGTNDLCRYNGSISEQSAEDIASDILRMGDTCEEFHVGRIVFSGITVRRCSWEGEIKRREINSLLRSGCVNRGYCFINNDDNIVLSDIEDKPYDKVHLLESGSVKLANNILRVLNDKA